MATALLSRMCDIRSGSLDPCAPAPRQGETGTGDWGIVFESSWTTALGTSDTAIRDGGRWNRWDDWGGGQLLAVVPGGPPGYANALRVQQRGTRAAARVQRDDFVPPCTDFYIRYYMRVDDTSSAEDHIISTRVPADDGGLIYAAHKGGPDTWTYRVRSFSGGPGYPVASFRPNYAFKNGEWYRFEINVRYVTPHTIQHSHRVYDASGQLLLTDADFRQDDYGSSSWRGSNTWTLKGLYAAGYGFSPADLGRLRDFSMGNNGQSGATDTGLFWYYAGVQIRTDRWPGP